MAAHLGRRRNPTTRGAFNSIELPGVPAIDRNAVLEHLFAKTYNARFGEAERHALEIYFKSDCRNITGALPQLRGAWDPLAGWTKAKMARAPEIERLWWRSKEQGGKANVRVPVEVLARSPYRDQACAQLKRQFQEGGWRPLPYLRDGLAFHPTEVQRRAAQRRKHQREFKRAIRQTGRNAAQAAARETAEGATLAIQSHFRRARDERRAKRTRLHRELAFVPPSATGGFLGGEEYHAAQRRFAGLGRGPEAGES